MTTTTTLTTPIETITAGRAPREVTAAITSMISRHSIPGLSIAVVDRDGPLFAGGYGFSDLTVQAPTTASTSYLWFSMTKIVTATAAMRLADRGLLDLAAPAGQYVSELRAPGTRQPTVRDLLTHTAGLGNPLPLRWAHSADRDSPDPATLLTRVMARRRAYRYPIGGPARYSNVGYLALGRIITAVTGAPFEDHVQRSVLSPLGLQHTGFRYPDGAERATGYVRIPRVADPALRRLLPAGIAGDRHGKYLALNPFYVDGPAYGGLVGNVLDAARFLRMHLRDGELDGRRILTEPTARGMRVIDHPGKPFDHGVGWFRRPTAENAHWVEHFGTGAGFWNVMRLYPRRGIGVVVMTNTTSKFDFEPLFAQLVDTPWR